MASQESSNQQPSNQPSSNNNSLNQAAATPPPLTPADPSDQFELARSTLGTILFARTLANVSYRIIYPFLPALARGLEVSLQTAGQLVAVTGLVGLVAPFFGPLSDRYGRRRMMEVALLLLAVASIMVLVVPSYRWMLLAFAGMGLAKSLYDPAMQAYIGDLVPYGRRGRVLAITELAWSFAWMFGVPISGLLIERFGWQSPWALIALLSLLAMVITQRVLPPAHVMDRKRGENSRAPGEWRAVLRQPVVWRALLIGAGIIFAIENIFIVYGAFLESTFGLSIGAIGIVSVVIGVAELAAEGGAAAWTDRLGPKRSVILGFAAFGVSLLLLTVLRYQLSTALFSFALVILCFEFTLVSFIPLMSELAPSARATLLSMNIAALGVGRLLASVIGPFLYTRTDSLLANALLSAVVAWGCGLLLWRGVPEQPVIE